MVNEAFQAASRHALAAIPALARRIQGCSIDSPIGFCFFRNPGRKDMTYDWDGQRTRRIQIFRIVSAIAVALMMTIALTAWSYSG
jgi:hypothetical protein